MERVNYIIQLNAVFDCFNKDTRIKQGHITLYLAFFQKWNRQFFKKTITINRELIMEKAKFKSKTTYHNYLRDLNNWGYLKYFPSYHPSRGSKVQMAIFLIQIVKIWPTAYQNQAKIWYLLINIKQKKTLINWQGQKMN